MPRKSPFTDAIVSAWDKLVLEKGAKLSLNERIAGWEELDDLCKQDGVWVVGFQDACLVGMLGVTLAFERKEWALARHHAKVLLQHKDALNDKNRREWESAKLYETSAALLCGEVEEGIAGATGLLDQTSGRARRSLLYHLHGVLSETTSDSIIDPKLSEYAETLIGGFPGSKRIALQAKRASTHDELALAVRLVLDKICPSRVQRRS